MKKILAWLSVMALCLSLVGGAFAPAHHAPMPKKHVPMKI